MNKTELGSRGHYGSGGRGGSSSHYSSNQFRGGSGEGLRNSANGWSGTGYDRWVERNSSPGHNTTLGKVQRQFWFTKSAVMRKLGKNQDEHIVASDAELDAKMELFKAIESSTRELQLVLAEYQSKVCVLAQEENSMGRLLKDWGRQDRGTANQVMTATGKSLSYTAQQRLALRAPLVRLFQEVDTFQTRAIEDTSRTLSQMEKMRTEYRGALMWMKKISQDFNPDQYNQLEKFRQVQEIVRQKKAKFDVLKIKCIQKIDLLAASRCNMFSHALIIYQNAIITFSEKTSNTLNSVSSNFKGYQHYNFQVIKELSEPEARRAIDEGGERGEATGDDERTFFNADYHDDEEREGEDKQKNLCPRHGRQAADGSASNKNSDSLLNLYEGSDSEGKTGNRGDKTEAPLSDLDLLCDGSADTEADTQQMLKDLFDSPVHKPMPPNYSSDLAHESDNREQQGQMLLPSQGHQPSWSEQAQQSGQMFMPSHLLDFGLLDWDRGTATSNTTGNSTTPQSSSTSGGFQETASQQSSAVLSTPLRPSALDASSQVSGDTQGAATVQEKDLKRESVLTPSSTGQHNAGGGHSTSGKNEKLDWFKVFQDIDPLSDPANDFFNKKDDQGGSC